MEMQYDENTLHQLERELDVQLVPGTEIMADVGNHHFVKSSAASGRVLVPQPSDNPHDPLVIHQLSDLNAYQLTGDGRHVELEPSLEVLYLGLCNSGDLHASNGPSRECSAVSLLDQGVRL
ncbi:MAG: hypothetical protein LQ338_000048 [Usnochroma carphineum]|nr:MAG: hypothetical protein LQ338_000048 [Usnochroma carphineum]